MVNDFGEKLMHNKERNLRCVDEHDSVLLHDVTVLALVYMRSNRWVSAQINLSKFYNWVYFGGNVQKKNPIWENFGF